MRIVLTGTYCSANKGDAAMELATGMTVRERLPGAEITIATAFPDIDRALYADHGMKVVRSHRRRLLWAGFQLARCTTYGQILARTGRKMRWLLPEQELRTMADAQLVIDLSGDMLTEDYGPHVAVSHFYPLLIALALDRPLYLCAQSIGPFKLTRPLARWILNRADRITVRDEISWRYLDELGIDTARRTVTADAAFLLPAQPGRERMRRLVGAHWDKPVIGVSLSYLVAGKWQPGGQRKAERIAAFARAAAAMLDRLVDQHDATIVFFPHVTGPVPGKDDRKIGRSVRSHMAHRDRAVTIDEDLSPGAIKGLIAECTVMLGARMHANIAALSSAVPVVAIAYSHKTPGIMQSLGQGDCVLAIDNLDFDRAFDMLTLCMKERARRVKQLRQALPETLDRARANFDPLADLVG